MPKIYSRNCDYCGKYYKKSAKRFCSKKCYGLWITYKSPRRKVLRNCITCGKEFYIRASRINQGRGKNCSLKCRHEYQRLIIAGNKNPNWKGGITSETLKRCNEYFWKRLRKIIYKRDNWTCQECGKKCHTDIQCHHKVPYRISKNDSMNNLITLCKSCHIKIERQLITNIG